MGKFKFNRKRAWFLYNQFDEEARDMPFKQFCEELDAMHDPVKAAHDMQRMSLTQRFQKDNKQIIENALARKRGGTGL